MLIPTKKQNYKDVTKPEFKFQTLDICATSLKAAKLYEAKGDVRYYLNAIQFNKDGYLAATNGHTLIKIDCEECKRLEESLIIEISGAKIPAKAKLARLTSTSDKGGFVEFGSFVVGDIKELRPFSIIEGKYPDIEKVLPKGPLVSVKSIGIDPKYLIQAQGAQDLLSYQKGLPIALKFRGKYEPVEIGFCSSYGAEAVALIMPCKEMGE